MSSRVKFVTMGYIEWRKGQDILVDAIELLSDEEKENADFILIGQNSSLMAQQLNERIEGFPSVSMPGTVSRDAIHDILESADVMICPSREDPMPTVCAEAMMHRVPCLVSDATGTASYIRDGYDGLVFKSEDVYDLKNKISWCIDNLTDIRNMGDRAYNIYKRVFAPEVFEANLLKYVEEMI